MGAFYAIKAPPNVTTDFQSSARLIVLWTFDGHGDAQPSADAKRSNAALEILILHFV